MSTTLTVTELAEIAAAELAAGRTAIFTPAPGDVFAISANGHWDYEVYGDASWAIWDRRANELFGFAHSPDDARRQTFEADHPLHDHPRPEPRPVRYEVI
jgi:hypothetical protein